MSLDCSNVAPGIFPSGWGGGEQGIIPGGS